MIEPLNFYLLRNKLLENYKSALTVSLVNIPLSVALAISSGASVNQGIITAFWAGIIAAFFGGSHFNIIGPTGALAGLLLAATLSFGVQTLPVIAFFSGLLIFLAYAFKLEKYIIFIPKSVVHGFTLGIAIVLIISQLNNAFGIYGLEQSQSILMNAIKTLIYISQSNPISISVFVFSVIFLLVWNKKIRAFPSVAALVFLSILVMFIFFKLGIAFNLKTIGDSYQNLKPNLFNFSLPNLSLELLLNKNFWSISITVAVVAILETLLSGKIADNLTNTKFNQRKEIFGLSLANTFSSFFGAIPSTAALARTALNIKSGANHKTSAIVGTIFLAIITVFFLQFFQYLPMPIIAGVLTFVAISMVQKQHFQELRKTSKSGFILSLVIAGLVVLVGPMIAILFGVCISLLMFIKKVANAKAEIIVWNEGKTKQIILKEDFLKKGHSIESEIVVYKISGTLTYMNMPEHLEACKLVRNNKYVIVSLRNAFYIDGE